MILASTRLTERIPSRAVLLASALLPGLILSLWYEARAFTLAGTAGFPLDDAWIHAQFARNIATGAGFTYTGGTWVSGSTAPAWTCALAVGYFVVRDIVSAAVILGLASQAAAGYFGFRVAAALGAPLVPSLFAGAGVACAPVIVWGAVSGMEVPLAAALMLAGILFVVREEDSARSFAIAVLLLTLASLARPESLFVVALVMTTDMLRPNRADRLRRVAIGAAIACALLAPIVIFSLWTIGRPLPSTFYAKSGPGIVRAIEIGDRAMMSRALTQFGPSAVRSFGAILLDQLSAVVVLVPVGLVACISWPRYRRAGLILFGVLVLTPYAIGVTAPQRLKPDNVRYAGQLVVLALPLAAAGVAWIAGGRGARAAVLSVAAVAWICWSAADRADMFALAVKNIQQLHVTAGKWMHDHLPAGTTVATNDVGAIAYFGGHDVLDLEGLVTPKALAYRQLRDRGLRLVMDAKPEYLAIFPQWYPDLTARPDLFREIHRFHIGDNYISAGDTMIVYETPWSVSGARQRMDER